MVSGRANIIPALATPWCELSRAGVYGWSTKFNLDDSRNLLATTVLQGGHLEAFQIKANLSAIAGGVAAMVAAAGERGC